MTFKLGQNNGYRTESIGFSLVELLVYLSVVMILSSTIFATVNSVRAKARDGQRIADLGRIVYALEQYKDANGTYPPVTTSGAQNLAGWEVSFYPDFIEGLNLYLTKVPLDPLNIGPPVITDGVTEMFNTRPDGSYFYMYYNYASGCCGCSFPFAVVGFRSLESKGIDKTKFPQASCGSSPCTGGPYPEFNPGVCRNWRSEFDYSLMLVE